MAKEIPGPWVRRPITVLSVSVATLLSPLVTPIALLVAGVVDVMKGQRFRRCRAVLLISGLIVVDFAGMLRVLMVWLFSPVGIGVDRFHIQERYRNSMTWWTNRLVSVIATATPLPFDYSQLDPDLLGGNAIVVGRHRSLLDAIVPAAVFGNQGRRVLYVLKDDLQWDINIDVVGQRMGHVFVNRSPKDLEAELEPIRELGRKIDDNAVGVIFPEGTFFSQRRKNKAIASLQRRNPKHAKQAEQMKHLLPPRPAGTLALLEGAPDADIIMLGHIGFEPFGTIGRILEQLGGNHKVIVHAWRFDRSEVPADADDQIDWLFDRWVEMDAWIESCHQLSMQPSP